MQLNYTDKTNKSLMLVCDHEFFRTYVNIRMCWIRYSSTLYVIALVIFQLWFAGTGSISVYEFTLMSEISVCGFNFVLWGLWLPAFLISLAVLYLLMMMSLVVVLQHRRLPFRNYLVFLLCIALSLVVQSSFQRLPTIIPDISDTICLPVNRLCTRLRHCF